MTTFRDPIITRRFRQAIKALLSERHGHVLPGELARCTTCVGRMWTELAKVAPECHQADSPDLAPEQR